MNHDIWQNRTYMSIINYIFCNKSSLRNRCMAWYLCNELMLWLQLINWAAQSKYTIILIYILLFLVICLYGPCSVTLYSTFIIVLYLHDKANVWSKSRVYIMVRRYSTEKCMDSFFFLKNDVRNNILNFNLVDLKPYIRAT